MPPLSPSWIGWLVPFLQVPDTVVIRECGLDCHMFLRFLRTQTYLMVVSTLVVCPLVMSLNLFGGVGDKQTSTPGLDRLTWSGISLAHRTYYWGHLSAAVLIVVYTCYIVTRELHYLVKKTSKESMDENCARTILVTDIPPGVRDADTIRSRFSHVPGGALEVEFIRDTHELDAQIVRRDKVWAQLERAEVKYLQSRIKTRKWPISLPDCLRHLSPFALPNLASCCEELWQTLDSLSRAVAIDQCKEYKPMSSALICFQTSAAALIACSSAFSKDPFSFKATILSGPHDVLWRNACYGWKSRAVREALALCVTSGLTLGWAIPIAMTGALSHLDYLRSVPQVGRYITYIPPSVLAILQGILPQTFSAVLMMVFPFALRLVINLRKVSTVHEGRLLFQRWYFVFLFIHLFLTVSISSGLAAILDRLLGNVKSVPSLLAENLPQASNYFLSYILMQALFVSASLLSQAVRFCASFCAKYFGTQTPHLLCAQQLFQLDWGYILPIYTNLACIGKLASLSLLSSLILGSDYLFGYCTVDSANRCFGVRCSLDSIPLCGHIYGRFECGHGWTSIFGRALPIIHRPLHA